MYSRIGLMVKSNGAIVGSRVRFPADERNISTLGARYSKIVPKSSALQIGSASRGRKRVKAIACGCGFDIRRVSIPTSESVYSRS